MRAVDLIQKKRDGQALSPAEIEWFIEAYTAGDIPDYQAAALLMAVFWRGMNREETVTLTLTMARSGRMLDLSDVADYVVDKHSSGGVGDKTSLIVLPLVAACGVPIAKMSGRGLGFSGGTLDKLEAIAGIRVGFSEDEFRRMAKEHSLVLAGQTAELAPADGKLYALRDVTATVDSLPLIASSIMSKKLASGANGIVLDVKVGAGAFMKTVEEARALARTMVEIGTDAGRDMIATLSDMQQPLGNAVGNAIEVRESIEALRGNGPADLVEHCLVIAGYMLRLAGRGERWTDDTAVRQLLSEKLQNGEAFQRFREMVSNQGGDVAMVDDPARLPQARLQETVSAPVSGNIARVAADQVAQAALTLGAGRMRKEDAIDHAVGVDVLVNIGDAVEAGQAIARIHANDEEFLTKAREQIMHAVQISADSVEPLPLFYGVIEG